VSELLQRSAFKERIRCIFGFTLLIDDDDDENDWKRDQSTISTGVPRSTLLKKISAILPGIRMHP
jgi:hypothetical protein